MFLFDEHAYKAVFALHYCKGVYIFTIAEQLHFAEMLVQSKEFERCMGDAPLEKMFSGFKCVGTYRHSTQFVKCCMLIHIYIILQLEGSPLAMTRLTQNLTSKEWAVENP